ncbi:MAG: hypothetical protein AAGF93_06505 [Cyanobacteria bacterium P01_H01_bin.105]
MTYQKTYQQRARFIRRLMIEGIVAVAGLGMLTAMPVVAYELVSPWQVAQGVLYSSSPGRFAISFPTTPEITTEDDDIDGDPVEIKTFRTATTTSQYMVMYTDLPTTFLSQGTEDVLDALRDYSFEDIDIEALLASEINVQLGGHPGRRYRYSQGDGTIDIRLYLVDERAYLLLAVDNNETNVDRFISSFALR